MIVPVQTPDLASQSLQESALQPSEQDSSTHEITNHDTTPFLKISVLVYRRQSLFGIGGVTSESLMRMAGVPRVHGLPLSPINCKDYTVYCTQET